MYSSWVKECTVIFSNLHDNYEQPESVVRLIIGVRNDGTRPASKMRVTFEAQGHVLIRHVRSGDNDDSDDAVLPNLPAPPAPPTIRKIKTRSKSAVPRTGDLSRSYV